jgi:ribosomal-protein-alanine N-acetyltransferase
VLAALGVTRGTPILAVDPAERRHGAGRALVHAAMAEGGSRGATQVYLEVRKSNTPAQSFYARLGFTVTGRRPGYYTEPDEDAVLMARTVQGPP